MEFYLFTSVAVCTILKRVTKTTVIRIIVLKLKPMPVPTRIWGSLIGTLNTLEQKLRPNLDMILFNLDIMRVNKVILNLHCKHVNHNNADIGKIMCSQIMQTKCNVRVQQYCTYDEQNGEHTKTASSKKALFDAQ